MIGTIAKGATTAAVAASAGFGWGLVEASLFTIRRLEAPLLPPGGQPLKVLHVSDVHLMADQKAKLSFVSSLAELGPDLVINTGDNISEARSVEVLADAWSDLLRVPGAFVFGSNDYYSPIMRNPLSYLVHGKSTGGGKREPDLPWRELRDRFSEHGWVDLTHRRETLNVNGYRIALRGTDDAHLGRDRYEDVAGPADAAADLNVGVTHAPYLRLLDAMTSDGMDLIFAGHTHGGQVCVPGYGALITNCDLDTRRVKGLSTHTVGSHTAHLHVSAGVGTSPAAPYRFACRPEVTLLTLVPSS